jgi:hypothetical protein
MIASGVLLGVGIHLLWVGACSSGTAFMTENEIIFSIEGNSTRRLDKCKNQKKSRKKLRLPTLSPGGIQDTLVRNTLSASSLLGMGPIQGDPCF